MKKLLLFSALAFGFVAEGEVYSYAVRLEIDSGRAVSMKLTGAAQLPAAEGFTQVRPHAPMFFYDGKWAVEARWPNEGWATFTETVDTGIRGRCLNSIAPDNPPVAGAFKFDSERPEKWNFGEGVYLCGYFTHDWSYERIQAKDFDAAKKIMTMAAPASYGIGGETWSANKERRFFATGVRAELDKPGEYYYDRKTGKVDFIAPEGMKEFIAVTNEAPLLVIDGEKDKVFDGVRFEYAINGVIVRNSEGIVFRNCVFRNIGGEGLVIEKSKNCRVENCTFSRIGRSCVMVSGGDRKKLIPGGNVVANCEFSDFAKVNRTYSSAVVLSGCGNAMIGCKVHDAPHSACFYSRGNDLRIVSNEVWNVMYETGDCGAFYAGRDPTSRGNLLGWNYVHDVGTLGRKTANVMAFYLDDCDCGDTLISNKVVNVPRGVLLGGGQDNHLIGNEFVNCDVGVSLDDRGCDWTDKWDSKTDASWQMTRKAKEMPIHEEPWKSRYPCMDRYFEKDPRRPYYNDLVGNVFRNCRLPFECWLTDSANRDLMNVNDNRVFGKDGKRRKITYAEVLGWMNDNDSLTRFPDAGSKARLWSSYDRRSVSSREDGWYANDDWSQYVRTETNAPGRIERVMVDQKGTGMLTRMWYTTALLTGEPYLRFYLDGKAEPVIEGKAEELIGGDKLIGEPWSVTLSKEAPKENRGHNLYLPITFNDGCKVTVEYTVKDPKAMNGFFYNFETREFPFGCEVETFTPESLLHLVTSSSVTSSSCHSVTHTVTRGRVTLPPGGVGHTALPGGPSAIREIRLRCDENYSPRFTEPANVRDIWIRLEFDGRVTAEMPITAFFGTGFAPKNFETRFTAYKDGEFICRWTMPYKESAKVTLLNKSPHEAVVKGLSIACGEYDWDERSMYFCAWYNDRTGIRTRENGTSRDLNYVDLNGRGVIVGTATYVRNDGNEWWGEGDEKVYVDGEKVTTFIGTGTEDYYGYAWCRPETFEHPFLAQPEGAGNLRPGYSLNIRHRVLDAIPFHYRCRFDMELWHWRDCEMDYRDTTWYYFR